MEAISTSVNDTQYEADKHQSNMPDINCLEYETNKQQTEEPVHNKTGFIILNTENREHQLPSTRGPSPRVEHTASLSQKNHPSTLAVIDMKLHDF